MNDNQAGSILACPAHNLTSARVFNCPCTIGVLADTHIWSTGARQLPEPVIGLFQRAGVNLILHAGDLNDVSVLERLSEIAPVIAVAGNNDDANLQRTLNPRERIRVGAHHIGLVHGHGGRSARDAAFSAFPEGCDLVVYGHSHIPRIEQQGTTTYFNPGSPADRRWSPHFGMGIIRCDDQGLHPRIIVFSRAIELDSIQPVLPGKDQRPKPAKIDNDPV